MEPPAGSGILREGCVPSIPIGNANAQRHPSIHIVIDPRMALGFKRGRGVLLRRRGVWCGPVRCALGLWRVGVAVPRGRARAVGGRACALWPQTVPVLICAFDWRGVYIIDGYR